MVFPVYRDSDYGYKGFFATSTDTKPTDCKEGSWCFEYDTSNMYVFDGTTWYLI